MTAKTTHARGLRLATATLGLALLGTASGAHASLIGDQVTAEVQFDGSTGQGPASAVVGVGTEFDFGNVDIDIGALNARFFDIPLGRVGGEESYILSDLDFLGITITGVTSAFSGLSIAPTISFSGDILSVILAVNTEVFAGASVDVDFITGPAAVTEPAALALLGFGILGLAATRRRRA